MSVFSLDIDDYSKVASPEEVAEVEAHFIGKTEALNGVIAAYVTPGASWSDHCGHEYVEQEFQHTGGVAPKCQLNGVAYLVKPHTKVKELINSADLMGSIGVYEVTSFGEEIDKLLRDDSASAVSVIAKCFERSLKDIKEFVASLFPSTLSKTADSVFEGYELDEESYDPVEVMKMRGGHFKIASRNGFVYIGHYLNMVMNKENKRQIETKVKVFVRSYDEMTAVKILNKINRHKDLTVDEFIRSSEYSKLREEARVFSHEHQGHIAMTIINEILGWSTKTGYSTTFERYSNKPMGFIHATRRFNYNGFTLSDSSAGNQEYVYYDHCLIPDEASENGFWPYMRGRLRGISLITPREPDVKRLWSALSREKRVFALPMGCRKLVHRSSYRVNVEYTEESKALVMHASEASEYKNKMAIGRYVTHWHGYPFAKNYKLTNGKYQCKDIKEILKHVYAVDPNYFEIIDMDTWSNDFGQEFSANIRSTMGIYDQLALIPPEEFGIIAGIKSDFCREHFYKYIVYCAEVQKKTAKQAIPMQNLQTGQFAFHREYLQNYLLSLK